jgi:predicted esterase
MAELPLFPTQYSLSVPSSFLHRRAEKGAPLLLFLHGYADSAPSFLRRLYPEPDPRFEILAPNGPFPQPQRVEAEWKEAYAWYFADLSKNKIYIPPDAAAKAVAGLVRELGLESRRKILVGFSQGGYFLPHLARELGGVERFLAVGAGFHPEFFERYGLTKVPIDAIHGTDDEVIPLAEAEGDFTRLTGEGRGELVRVPGMKHKIDARGRAAFAEWLGAKVRP